MPFKGLSSTLSSNEDHSLLRIVRSLQKVELNVFIYNETIHFEKKCSDVTEILSALQHNDTAKCVWIEVTGPMEERHDAVRHLGYLFGLHSLTLEDIQTTEERMKLDIFDDAIYLLMKMIYINEHNQTNIQQQQISFYLKDNLLITFQEKRTHLFLPIKQRLANSRGRLTKLKSDYLFYCLVDIIIDNYMIALGSIGLKIEHIDDELMQMKSIKLDTLKLIYNIKHDMLHFRIMCSPLKDIIIKLQKAQDRLPRRDPFAAQRRGLKPLPKTRGRRRNRPTFSQALQPIKSRAQSVSPTRANTSPRRKSRGQSVSPTRTNTLPRRRARQSLPSEEVSILHEYIFMYFKDLHDHIRQMDAMIETYSEMISWLVRFYMALNQNAANQTMTLLTMIISVFQPMLLILGLNSMNFTWVPQRDNYHNSYFIFLGILALISSTMITLFKIKKWF